MVIVLALCAFLCSGMLVLGEALFGAPFWLRAVNAAASALTLSWVLSDYFREGSAP